MKTIIQDIWSVLFPIVQLIAITGGPFLVASIGARAAAFLKISNDVQRSAFEKNLADALHSAAINALKVITTRFLTGGSVTADQLRDVLSSNRKTLVDYVVSKNPDAVKHFGLGESDIMDIIQSKVPDLFITGAPRS